MSKGCSLTIVTLCLATALSGCWRQESHASEPTVPLKGLAMVEKQVPGLGTFMLPQGWRFTEGAYPSEFSDQNYRMVRAVYNPADEDHGMLSIDISPSHPKVWRKALEQHAGARLKGLARVGDVVVVPHQHALPELPYEAEDRLVTIGSELITAFRVFRQKSRVITVAYTATPDRFETALARELVHRVSDTMLIDLPIVTYEPPDLTTTLRVVAGLLEAELPPAFVVSRHRVDYTLVPTQVIELTLPGFEEDNDRPLLTLSVLRLSLLGPGVEVEGLAVPPGGQEVNTGGAEKHATVLQVDSDTLAALRVVRLGNDVLTVTYAAPDYLFDVKDALQLLNTIAQSARLAPLDETFQ